MSTYVLCKNVTAVQAAPVNQGLVAGTTIGTNIPPPGVGLPDGSFCVQPNTTDTNVTNPLGQTFEVMVTCSAGNCNAVVQMLASNDGINWVNYGTAVTVASGASPNLGSSTGTATWEYFSAYVTTLVGTNAAVQVLMGC